MTEQRLQDAAEWLVRRESRPDADDPSFEAWRADPANERTWRAVDEARRCSTTVADDPALLALRHAALARAVRDRPGHGLRHRWAYVAACAAAALPFAWMIGSTDPETPVPAVADTTYRTVVGQRLAVTLPDGSRLTLDTNSRVRVAYGRAERRLILDRGQALFEVAKRQDRPFVVIAGEQRVVAHGTQFDVRVGPGVAQVALIEGKVTVADARAPAGAGMAMAVDDVLTATPRGISVRHVPGGALAMASWSEGRLVFSDRTLASAVAEMNRYGVQPIRIVDPRAGALRVSGSFRTGEIVPFVEALEAGFPVTVRHLPTGSVEIAYRR